MQTGRDPVPGADCSSLLLQLDGRLRIDAACHPCTIVLRRRSWRRKASVISGIPVTHVGEPPEARWGRDARNKAFVVPGSGKRPRRLPYPPARRHRHVCCQPHVLRAGRCPLRRDDPRRRRSVHTAVVRRYSWRYSAPNTPTAAPMRSPSDITRGNRGFAASCSTILARLPLSSGGNPTPYVNPVDPVVRIGTRALKEIAISRKTYPTDGASRVLQCWLLFDDRNGAGMRAVFPDKRREIDPALLRDKVFRPVSRVGAGQPCFRNRARGCRAGGFRNSVLAIRRAGDRGVPRNPAEAGGVLVRS